MAAEIMKFTANEKEFVAAFERASGALGKFTAEMNIKMSKAFQQADRTTSNLNRGLGRLSNTLKSISLTGLISLTLPLGAITKFASDKYAEIDSLKKGLQTLDPSLENVNKRVDELTKLARLPALGFEEALRGDVRLRTVNYTMQESSRILREFSNAVARSGGGMAQLNEITYQLSQSIGKGKLLTQDWRPIIEAAPAVGDALTRLYGTTSIDNISSKISSQGKSVRQFVNELLDELEKAPRVVEGYKVKLENLNDTINRTAAGTFELADKTFNLSGEIS